MKSLYTYSIYSVFFISLQINRYLSAKERKRSTSKCYKIGKLPKIHSRTYFPVKQDSYEFSKYLRGTKSRNEEG